MIRPLPALLAVTIAAAGLAGCGKQGELERPAPMWGAKRAAYEQQRAEEARQREAATKPGEAAPPVQPTRSAPIPGANPDPFGSPPPGVLPDPYARPQ